MNTLQVVLLNPVVVAAASGIPSTCEVLSTVTRADTEEPQAASMAGPTARTGGEVMMPWERTGVAARAAIRRGFIKTIIGFVGINESDQHGERMKMNE